MSLLHSIVMMVVHSRALPQMGTSICMNAMKYCSAIRPRLNTGSTALVVQLHNNEDSLPSSG